MKKIKIEYEYSGKMFQLSPYNTSQEKSILLMDSLGSRNIDNALEICDIDTQIIQSLTNEEKIAMLYKLRSISVGEEISVNYICNNCKCVNESDINIENIVESSNITNKNIIDRYKLVNKDNIQDFLKIPIEELYLDEYDNTVIEIYSSVTKFDFIKKTNCIKCKSVNNIDISKMIIEQMSEDSLASLYQTYNDLNYFGNYTKNDIDTMFPFERTILLGLLNKTREDINIATR